MEKILTIQDALNSVNSQLNFNFIIDDTLKKYNYKGKNFNVKFLPDILIMALQKYKTLQELKNLIIEVQEFSNKIKLREKNKSTQARELFKAYNIDDNLYPKGTLVRVKRIVDNKLYMGFYHI